MITPTAKPPYCVSYCSRPCHEILVTFDVSGYSYKFEGTLFPAFRMQAQHLCISLQDVDLGLGSCFLCTAKVRVRLGILHWTVGSSVTDLAIDVDLIMRNGFPC